ncbi:MAG: acetyl-CoA hydrolase/transferase C-terminal domain-containing protein [Acidimicrobiales bacterium]
MRYVNEGVIRDRLAALPGDEPRVVVAGNFATPFELVRILDGALPRCRVFSLNMQIGWPCRDGFITETPFVGPGVRHDPQLEYLPMRLSLVPRLFASLRPPDAVLLQTTPPRDGVVSLGIEVNLLPAAIEAVVARGGPVIAQVNPHMPFTRGDALIDADRIDLALEVATPLPSPASHPDDPVATAIGGQVTRYVSDGGTVQFGIGLIPDAAAAALRTARGLGIWSEMVSDGALALERSGALDPARPLTASFLFGSPELYEWVDDNPRVVMRRTEVVNDPARIAEQPAMLSVNTALEVDLFDQVNASYLRSHIFSGFGGQPDFVIGALHSPGGHAIVALRSWHEPSGSSCVIPLLQHPATSFQHSVIVTEHGAAEVFGKSTDEQARLLIEQTADPRARDGLREAAATRREASTRGSSGQ